MIYSVGMADGTSIIRSTAYHYLIKKCTDLIPFNLTNHMYFLQRFVNACKIERWAVVNFSARCDVRGLIRDLMRVGEAKGIVCILHIILLFLFLYQKIIGLSI